jgi:hypothetical protein
MVDTATPRTEAQSAAAVLTVRPASFGFNPQTAPSNAFQQDPQAGTGSGAHGARHSDLQTSVLREFDALIKGLHRAGVQVIVAEDSEAPVKPDAIFPNNWVSFHGDGTVVLYPMLAPNRRAERRDEIIQQVAVDGAFRITRMVDLSYREERGQYLEGTGSLVLDRSHRVAYANLSPRTDLDVLGEFAQQLDYELVTFEAFDPGGDPVYHTNVIMAIGSQFAAVCGTAIAAPRSRDAVFSTLRATGHEIVDLSAAQMLAFAGNLIELRPPAGNLIALSSTAWGSLDAAQRRTLERYGNILAAEVPTIERYGGGSVRCMLAEIHLPARR